MDWTALARLIKADRARKKLKQGLYGHTLGLSQFQISKLESGKGMSRPTSTVIEALRQRFGELPVLSQEASDADDAAPITGSPTGDLDVARELRALREVIEALREAVLGSQDAPRTARARSKTPG